MPVLSAYAVAYETHSRWSADHCLREGDHTYADWVSFQNLPHDLPVRHVPTPTYSSSRQYVVPDGKAPYPNAVGSPGSTGPDDYCEIQGGCPALVSQAGWECWLVLLLKWS